CAELHSTLHHHALIGGNNGADRLARQILADIDLNVCMGGYREASLLRWSSVERQKAHIDGGEGGVGIHNDQRLVEAVAGEAFRQIPAGSWRGGAQRRTGIAGTVTDR